MNKILGTACQSFVTLLIKFTYARQDLIHITRSFSYKNELYKNVEAENCLKFKNVLRMFRGSKSIQHRNLSMNLHKIWWCLLVTLHFYVKTILNTALYTSFYHYRYIQIHIPLYICCMSNQTEIESLSTFFCLYIPQKTEVSTKNVLRMFEAHFWKKCQNVEPR